MALELAREMLTRDTAQPEFLSDHYEKLVWAGHGDEVERFNQIVASHPGIPGARIDGTDGDVHITHRGTRVPVPVEFDCDDNLRSVYALGRLTGADLEFRMCRETSGTSEQAFLLLPPEQWQELEREFGNAAVARCFLPLAPTFHAFMEQALAGAADSVVQAAEARPNRLRYGIVRGRSKGGEMERLRISPASAEPDRLYGNPVVAAALKGLSAVSRWIR